jgi:hypothetical protein
MLVLSRLGKPFGQISSEHVHGQPPVFRMFGQKAIFKAL